MASITQASAGPLDGVLVIDMSRALAGPHAAMLLGDLGADVIKVEAPGKGDDTRSWGPPFVGSAPESTYFLSCNRNKRSITADLRDPEDVAVVTDLLRRADVLVENFRPGVMRRLGLGEDTLRELNPRLVIVSITGFGHDGPESERAGYDQILQGEAGLMSLTGQPEIGPTKVGVPIADLLAGIHACYGALAALYERESTGIGRIVHTSLLSSIVGVHAFQGTRWTVAHEVPPQSGDQHPSICPYGLFHCADSAVQIAVGNDPMWRVFAADFGLDRPEWATNPQRVGDRDKVIAAINATFGEMTAEETLSRLVALGIPAGRVRTLDQVYAWDQVASQGLLLHVDHPTLGELVLPGNPVRFDGNSFTGARASHTAPPTLGQHNDEVRQWLRAQPPAEGSENE